MTIESGLLEAFSDELQKVAAVPAWLSRGVGHAVTQVGRAARGVGSSKTLRSAGEAAKDFGTAFKDQLSAPLAALHPEGKYLRKGWAAMGNMNPRAIRASKEYASSAPGEFVNDYRRRKGVMAALRRSGWASNTPKYLGSDKLEKAKNLAWRAAPGQKSLMMVPAGLDTYSTLKQNVDPETGREIGLGERVLGAAAGAGTGVASMGVPWGRGFAGTAGGAIGGMAGYELGRRAGAGAGRALDKGVAKLRGKKNEQSLSPEEIQAIRARGQ